MVNRTSCQKLKPSTKNPVFIINDLNMKGWYVGNFYLQTFNGLEIQRNIQSSAPACLMMTEMKESLNRFKLIRLLLKALNLFFTKFTRKGGQITTWWVSSLHLQLHHAVMLDFLWKAQRYTAQRLLAHLQDSNTVAALPQKHNGASQQRTTVAFHRKLQVEASQQIKDQR